MRTTPFGVANWAATTPGVPCGATHSTSTSSSGRVDGVAEPVADPVRVAGDLDGGRAATSPVAPALGCCSTAGLPLDEERQLRVGLQALHADLAPAQLDAVGTVPVALDGLAAEPLLDLADVVDRDDPAEPAAAERGAGADGLAERCLVGGRVVEHLDDLDVGAGGQRQHHVAGAEAGVDAAVAELLAEQRADAVRPCSCRPSGPAAYETWSRRIRSIVTDRGARRTPGSTAVSSCAGPSRG